MTRFWVLGVRTVVRVTPSGSATRARRVVIDSLMDLEPGEQPRYAPVLAGPHLMGKFRRSVTP